MNYTFTPADAGTHTFPASLILRTGGSQVVTIQDVANATITGSAGVTVGPATPTGLVATGSPASVSLTWSPVTGAVEYQVWRRAAGGDWTELGSTLAASFTDGSVTASSGYAYRVRALDGDENFSSFSTADVATTFTFTDEPIVAGTTTVKAAHLTQLRQAANALRAAAGMTPSVFTDPTVGTALPVKAIHIDQLRTAITQARDALGIAVPAFADGALTGVTVKATHAQQLRDAVK
jgi:hypothetical protein